MKKDMKKLQREIEALGPFKTRETSNGHLYVSTKDGKPVATISGTPSDHRSIRNSLQAIRRHGFPDFRR